MNRYRVVITGVGAVSPNALGAANYARACRAGTSGLSRVKFSQAGANDSAGRDWIVGRVRDFQAEGMVPAAEAQRMPRTALLALAAAREALGMAQVRIDAEDVAAQRRIGISLGTGGGGVEFVERQYERFFSSGKGSLYSITAGTHGNLSSELSIALRLRGPSHVISTGCTSSTDAIGHAMMLIRGGVVPMMVAGGADAPIAPGVLAGFEQMRVLSKRHWEDPAQASRPFAIDRDGFVLAEGAWMFLLEQREHALQRGATILAELAGYASTCDAYHRVRIDPDVQEPVRAMELALADAGIAAERVGYVNLHGTGTMQNDRLETAAIKRCFGRRAWEIPMSATKSMIGHPQGACGAAGLAATVLLMREGVCHPTINLQHPDPECDLDYIPDEARPNRVESVLCNCIGFGSKNSALVVSRQ